MVEIKEEGKQETQKREKLFSQLPTEAANPTTTKRKIKFGKGMGVLLSFVVLLSYGWYLFIL
jgi:hypothetical protein